MVVIRERTTARGMLEMSTPSIVMVPERMERRRKIARISELLPLFCIRNELIQISRIKYLPVLPHIPIFSPSFIEMEMSRKIISLLALQW